MPNHMPIAPITLNDLAGRATLSIDETAQLLGLGRSAVYEATRRGQMPSRRLGRRLLVPVPLLLAWLGATTSDAA